MLMNHRLAGCALAVSLLAGGTYGPSTLARTSTLAPTVYTIRFPDPAAKAMTVDVAVPSVSQPAVDLMMPVWSPGFYGVQNYAARVSDVGAKTTDGTQLEVTKP